MKIEINKFYLSFCNAFKGLKYAIKCERNFRVELGVALCVIFLILWLDVKNWEALVLVLMIMWILVVELINTAVERVVDILKPRIHPYARLIKDIMAAVVLISCISSLIIGIIIFLPYFKEFL